MRIQRIAVIGAGLMGSGIAQALATPGYQVHLCDVSEEALNKGFAGIEKSLARFIKAKHLSEQDAEDARSRITGFTELEKAVSDVDLVVEAVPENMELKKRIFYDLDRFTKPEVILATNTSELSVTAIASATKRPRSVVGMHWFNPPPVMRLVEIVRGVDTSEEAIEVIKKVSERAGKETVVVKDVQGFVTSRAISAHMMECMKILEEGVASAEDIDKAIRLGLNYPMGPFELADYVGLDTMLFASEGMVEAYGDRFRVPQTLRKLVEAGHLGRKSGKGFYDYTKERETVSVKK
ncbi:3-hydroxyacyl-CoA dehydrogenase family protein [Marininema halotolerans]|uniref:3-hydroxybutyryl-CoA dehydrogenase n=1 Tax=Marininema halotolerans TaxID=1155944 RepID=A0A1I6QNW1_9BACL|nr:3-hydroxyacyl-CoA dehydrogenase family protein [Marininema halotolerans]SFS54022.1 3-hydroxybutyryl-CoA dehydrogenase [Marininema halotolerans]